MPEDALGTMNAWLAPLVEIGADLGLRLLGALALWFVGRAVIRWIGGRVTQLTGSNLDPTLARYLENIVVVGLNVLLVLAILGVFGVETTTFAAVLAAAGVAIGMAWSGLLANFAAGAFMMVLRPFKVGDFVEAGGVTGTVDEIGLFVTTIVTLDNVKTFVGNNNVFTGTIRNYSANPHRRVDLVAQLAHSVEPSEAMELLKERLLKIPNVKLDPAPDVQILEFNLAGPVLCVRPFCHNDHYWQVYFDTNKAIRDTFGDKGYPVPEQHYRVQRQQVAGMAAA